MTVHAKGWVRYIIEAILSLCFSLLPSLLPDLIAGGSDPSWAFGFQGRVVTILDQSDPHLKTIDIRVWFWLRSRLP